MDTGLVTNGVTWSNSHSAELRLLPADGAQLPALDLALVCNCPLPRPGLPADSQGARAAIAQATAGLRANLVMASIPPLS